MAELPRVPFAFRAPRLLPALHVVSVSASLAALTATAFLLLFPHEERLPFDTGVSTFLVCAWWMHILRLPRKVGRTKVRLGFVLSLPLAALNASLAAGMVLARDSFTIGHFVVGMLAGLIYGAVFWIPAWLVTLFAFGAPLSRAHALAERGLAGRERGDGIVGVRSAVVGGLTLTGLLAWLPLHRGSVFAGALGLMGALAGLAAFLLARAREDDRRAFVREVAAGRVPHFRIERTDEGEALMRVLASGQGYRVADHQEELALLDAEGEVTRVEQPLARGESVDTSG